MNPLPMTMLPSGMDPQQNPGITNPGSSYAKKTEILRLCGSLKLGIRLEIRQPSQESHKIVNVIYLHMVPRNE